MLVAPPLVELELEPEDELLDEDEPDEDELEPLEPEEPLEPLEPEDPPVELWPPELWPPLVEL